MAASKSGTPRAAPAAKAVGKTGRKAPAAPIVAAPAVAAAAPAPVFSEAVTAEVSVAAISTAPELQDATVQDVTVLDAAVLDAAPAPAAEAPAEAPQPLVVDVIPTVVSDTAFTAPTVPAEVAPVAVAPVEVAAPVVDQVVHEAAPALVAPDPLPLILAPVVQPTPSEAIGLQEAARRLTQTGLERLRSDYDVMKKAAEDTTDALGASYETATRGLMAVQATLFEAARTQANTTFDLISAMIAARSLSEAIEVQSTHARRQMDAATETSRQVASAVQKLTTDTLAPLKSVSTRPSLG
jgi:hypothetical protein